MSVVLRASEFRHGSAGPGLRYKGGTACRSGGAQGGSTELGCSCFWNLGGPALFRQTGNAINEFIFVLSCLIILRSH